MKNSFKNVQIGDNDLIGNKFNGHDLHLYLRSKGIDSIQLVWNKESNDKTTFILASQNGEREKIRDFSIKIQNEYSLNGIFNPIFYNVLYNKYFLESDVVHFHLIQNWLIDISLLPILSRLKPIVWTVHDPWVLGGHCVYHFDCKKWQNQCFDCPYLNTHFSLKKDNSSLNFTLKMDSIKRSNIDIIVASKWMKNKIKLSPIFKNKKIHLIPFGINQDIFKPLNKKQCKKELGVNSDYFIITFRFDKSKFKGLDFILNTLENIKTNKKICLFILGNYKKNEYKFNLKYKYFGWVKDDRLLAKIYSSTDLFLMPSTAEAFGMMAIEAMSCGTLPIVLEGTSLPEIVNSPDCGIATKRSKKDYSEIVNFYINNDLNRKEKSLKCLYYAKEKYNYKKYIKKIELVYQESMKNHKLLTSDKFLLDQLKKNLSEEVSNNNENYIRQQLPYFIKILLILFYKIDKIIPQKTRILIKNKLKKLQH